MVAAAKSTADTMDVIDKGAQRMKISAEAYQELSYAAGLSGVSVEQLEKAAKKLEGTDINLDEALTQILAIEDASERSAAAAEMFGESVAYSLTPLLNAGADGMAEMRQEANDLGLVMSQDAVSAGAQLGDLFSKVEQSLGALKNSLAAEFMPYVLEALQWIVDNMPQITATVHKVFDAIMPIVKPILTGVAELFKAVYALVTGDTETFKESLVNALKNLGSALLDIVKGIGEAVWTAIKTAFAPIGEWFEEKFAWVKNMAAKIKNLFTETEGAEYVTEGSFATGTPFIPHDGYIAELHRGEAVLNQNQTGRLFDALQNQKPAEQSQQPIELTLNIDGAAFARATYNANKNESDRRGTSLVMV